MSLFSCQGLRLGFDWNVSNGSYLCNAVFEAFSFIFEIIYFSEILNFPPGFQIILFRCIIQKISSLSSFPKRWRGLWRFKCLSSSYTMLKLCSSWSQEILPISLSNLNYSMAHKFEKKISLIKENTYFVTTFFIGKIDRAIFQYSDSR